MIGPTNGAVADAQQRQLQALLQERETWIRVAVRLAVAIKAGATIPTVEGDPAVRLSEMAAVPGQFKVELRPVRVKPENGPPDAPDEEMLAVHVEAKPEKKAVIAPSRPRLIL